MLRLEWHPLWSARQAINDLHEDEDFQKDASETRMLEVVDEVRLNALALKKYEDDATVMHVLTKLRRFQVCGFRFSALSAPHSSCLQCALHPMLCMHLAVNGPCTSASCVLELDSYVGSH